jgi:RNA polymerase sigma factor (sigma-70 family)
MNTNEPLAAEEQKQLLQQVKQGGDIAKQAFGKLYDAYYGYVEYEANKVFYNDRDVEDFCQEVWKRVIEKLPAFDGDTLGQLLGKVPLGAEPPHGIIGHYYLKFIRDKVSILQSYSREKDRRDPLPKGKPRHYSLFAKAGRYKKDDGGEVYYLKDIIPSESKTPLEILIEKETRQIVREEIEKLPDIYRYVILMRYLDGRPCEEIARLLNISIGDVWERLSRAYEKLKEQLIKRMGKNPLEEVVIYRSKKYTKRK